MSQSNQHFSLAEVVSVEAWYEKFDETRKETDFFLHIRFQDGVFGAEPEMPVRFKIRLKKANLVVIPEEPIKVPKKNVRRDRITVEARKSFSDEIRRESELSGQADLEVSKTGILAKLSGKIGGAQKKAVEEKVDGVIASHSGMTIEHDVTMEKHNRWSFAPLVGGHLMGQAFHKTEPLMSLKISAELPKISPAVRVKVNCLKEDIDVYQLVPKEEKRGLLQKGMGEEAKLKLAEKIIIDELARSGLEFHSGFDDHSTVVVADCFASEE